MKKAKINIKNIIAYIQGNIRYKLYYSKNFVVLLQPHIKEQIHYRIASMRKTCYKQGQCELCGCQTTHLQMANKACDGNCYPEMLNKEGWKFLKEGGFVWSKSTGISWIIENSKFIKLC